MSQSLSDYPKAHYIVPKSVELDCSSRSQAAERYLSADNMKHVGARRRALDDSAIRVPCHLMSPDVMGRDR